MSRPRYKVVFTPVGWQVVDTVEIGDPVAEFGTGPQEYERAKACADDANVSPAYNKTLESVADISTANSQETQT